MESEADRHLNRLIQRLNDGDPEAANELFPLVLDDLRQRARRALRRHPRNHTLQPTALLNEAYLKLVERSKLSVRDRGHFIEIASKAMEWILIDHARSKNRKKRTPIELDSLVDYYETHSIDILDLHQALEEMAGTLPVLARVVRMRYFGGADERTIAETLGISTRTVQRHWHAAREWLQVKMSQ
ncbi:MAG: ECF-type sigma factor [Acidobacteriota bacterium]